MISDRYKSAGLIEKISPTNAADVDEAKRRVCGARLHIHSLEMIQIQQDLAGFVVFRVGLDIYRPHYCDWRRNPTTDSLVD